ncbi:hypothetical protein LCGC14_1016600, partial [marine sediment metagenome]
QWESLPLAPTVAGFYNQFTNDYDFWTWNPSGTIAPDKFRPFWGTTSISNMNTVSFGVNYPYDVTAGEIWFDDNQFDPSQGANFLDTVRSRTHDLYSYWSFKDDNNKEHHKVLYYDTSYNTNSFQFDNLIIDPNNFYTSVVPFPELNPSTRFEIGYSADEFYDTFINDDHEFRLELLTEKEAANPSDAYLTIGDFKTYIHTDSNYLNYDDFGSNINLGLPMQHVSDVIDLTSSGLQLLGEGGFNIKQDYPLLPIFRETFDDASWSLQVSEPTIYIDSVLTDDSYVSYYQSSSNYGNNPTIYVENQAYGDKSYGLIKLEYPYLDLGYTSDSVLEYYKYPEFTTYWDTQPGTFMPTYVYHTDNFNEDSVTWDTQPATGAYQTTFTAPSYSDVWVEQAIGSPNQAYKFKKALGPVGGSGGHGPWLPYNIFSFASTEFTGFEPRIKHYLSKLYQGDGIAYMQTDISEILNLRSPIYPSLTNIEVGDVIVIEFKTSTTNEIKLNFYNGGQKLDIGNNFVVVPDSNTDFNKQIIYLTVDETIGPITFDQIEFTGNLDDIENFFVYDIKVLRQGSTITETYKNSRNYDFLEQNSPRFPLLNYGSTTSGSPSSAHLSDNNYWSIASTNDKVSIDFLFEGESNIQELEKFEIDFEATGSITLDGNIEFSYYNYLSNDFELLSYSLVDNNFVLSLFNYDFDTIKDPADSQYKLLLKVVISDNNPFTVSIDSLIIKALEVWSANHDLYKASFKFIPLDPSGEIKLSLNRDIYTIITDSQYIVDETYTVSFYYDSEARGWNIYLIHHPDSGPDQITTLAGPVADPNPISITPRIESHFSDVSEGITVLEIESQYYIKVETREDFESYKTLVNSYKEGSFTDLFDIDSIDSLLIPENTFSQISSDIDIIYNFKDELVETNIFNPNLIHTEDFSSDDDLATTSYSYQEEVVLLDSNINLAERTYINGHTGDNYQISQGAISNLQLDGGGTITADRIVGSGSTNAEEFETPGAPNPTDPDSEWSSASGSSVNRGYPRKPDMTDPHLTYIKFGAKISEEGYDVPGWNQWADDDLASSYRIDGQTGGFRLHVFEEMKFYVGQAPQSAINFEFKMGFWAWANGIKECKIEIWNENIGDWSDLIAEIPWGGSEGGNTAWYYATLPGPHSWFVDDNFEVTIRIHTQMLHNFFMQHGWIAIYTDVARVIAEDYPGSKVEFTLYPNDVGKNYYVFYEGRTQQDQGAVMDFYLNNIEQFSIYDSYGQHNEVLAWGVNEIEVFLGEQNDGWIYRTSLESDYLYLIDINQISHNPIYNIDPISIDSSLSKSSGSVQGMWLEDPFLGATIEYTLENSIRTPVFGRGIEQIYTQFELDDIELEFDVFSPTEPNMLLEHAYIEGKDPLWDGEVVQNIDYTTHRFRDSAIDDIHIPLITPIELDFGQINTEGLSNIDLELALELNISLDYRSTLSPDWIWRPRLMIYNHTASEWVDFSGELWASIEQGPSTKVWEIDQNPIYQDTSNLHYLQYPNSHQGLFKEIGDTNHIEISSLVFQGLNVADFFSNGKIKLALLSYIVPGSKTDVGTGNYLHYDREDVSTPISISQSVDIKESVLLVETTNLLYSESVFPATLSLDSNYQADLSLLDPAVGEVVLVKGISEITPTFTEEYPLFNLVGFVVKDILTQPYIEITSGMRSEFTDIYIEYIPQLSLVSGPPWYLPSEYTKDAIKYEAPFFISEVVDDLNYYGTYIYPAFSAGFTIETDGQLYVDFTPLPPDNNPRGAIHFAKINDAYSNRFSIKDELVFNYDLLESPTDLSGGKLLLTLKSGFNDIMDGTELNQITANDYYVTVKLYKLDSNNNLVYIGKSIQPMNTLSLGFSLYELEIDFGSFGPNNPLQDIGNSLTQGYGNDLYVTVETTISNCLVDAHLFRGHFAQQILKAQIQIETKNTALLYNNIPVNTPYLELNHDNIQLDKIDENTYQFTSLKYYFDFEVIEVRTETGVILNSADYYFNSFDNSISLTYEYNGLIFADIIYHAFEWGVNSISTLEPITMSFSEDFISKYTSYLELEIEFNFDGIPGFEIMNLDSSSGKVVMTNEEKNADLLRLYLYNYKTDTYDFIDCVVYDNYGESDNFLPTFSYIIDRNFIVFEDYFNDLGTTFDISFILAVDESFDNYFASKINFGINSINAKIYHDPPNVEQFLNPQIVFDIDLSEYYSIGFDLDEISLEFYYLTTILNDESNIFSQYALIDEDIVFSIQNKYLEFETFTLEDGTAFFSQKEINNLLIHDKENDKYFIRIKLEYEWHSIIKINLGGTSLIEIISSVQLMKYNLNVKYTSTETVRISAFESSTPHDLAAIKAPNYFETDSGIIVFPDDTEVDIGLNSGFLRNIDTRQRLMIRQDLSYSFPDSQLGPIPILVDQSYSDTILRFKNPIGYLDSPTGIYLNNSKKFSYIAEFDVSTVELFWDDGTEHLVGQMVPNPIQPNRFEYEWKTIDVDTGITSGDTIDILIRLTDIFLATNDYHYYFEADFISPTPSISVGDGAQNFENNFASPLTDISFDNSITPSSELWNEPLSTYDPTQMSYNDYP